jgi:hypothetical protein
MWLIPGQAVVFIEIHNCLVFQEFPDKRLYKGIVERVVSVDYLLTLGLWCVKCSIATLSYLSDPLFRWGE